MLDPGSLSRPGKLFLIARHTSTAFPDDEVSPGPDEPLRKPFVHVLFRM